MRRLLQQSHSAALISLLVGMCVFPDLVLCVGDNGHRAFEIVADTGCRTGSASHSGCSALDDHCSATCSDVRLGTATVLAESSHIDITGDDIAKICAVALASVAPQRDSLPSAGNSRGGAARLGRPVPRDRHNTVQLC